MCFINFYSHNVKRAITLILLFLYGFSMNSQEELNGRILLEKAEKFNQKSNWDSAYTAAKESLAIFEALKNDSLAAKAASVLIYTTNHINYGEHTHYFIIGEEKALKTKSPELLSEIYYTKGLTHFENREMGLAEPYFLKVDSLATRHNLLNEITVKAIVSRSEISRITFTPKGVEQAHELQLLALDKAKKIHSELLINDLYLRLADMNGLIGNYPKAKHFADLAFAYYKKQDDTDRMAKGYLIYMNYYYALNDYNSAGKMLEEGIAYLTGKDNPKQLASMITAYGTFFRKRKKDCIKATEQYEKAKLIYEKINLTISDRYEHLMEGMALCYAANNEFEKAYEYNQKAYETKIALVKKENNDLTRELETKYQSVKKEQQIALFESHKQLAEQQKYNERLIFGGSLLIFILISLFLYVQFKNRQKTTKKLLDIDKAKSTFFTNISHELQTPITLINGPLEDQLASGKLDKIERKNIQTALKNTQRIQTLVNQLLELSKLESHKLKLQVQGSNLPQFLIEVAETFSNICSEKNISYSIQIEKDEIVDWFDRDIIEKIFYNLMGNALKYTPEGKCIIITGFRKNNYFEMSIQNYGIYIPEAEIKKIFNRFYKSDSLTPGAGIGLALSKELTEFHHGSIKAQSETDGKTVFSIKIPIEKSIYKLHEIFCPEVPKKEETPITENHINNKKSNISPEEELVLLIVDDNDDIRSYVQSIFQNSYCVLPAKNGKEGFNLALKNIPDIIISDVMMPKQDGFELTKLIKEHQLTSHIPIILLTAKNHVTAKLEGMSIGADAYVTKPFNPQLLQANVENLIETRRKLQLHFAQEVVLTPKKISVPTAEEQFLECLQKVLDKNITNPSFSIENFGSEMGISRMQLHRKLKALTGQSASEFLRSQRLNLAVRLLNEKKISISEVGYAVGFNDPSYFTRCFKQEFGSSPSEFISK